MKRKIIKIDVDSWFSNRMLRLCSPAARCFLLELRMLCVPSGYLEVSGQAMKDEQIASLVGSTVSKVREWFKELARAGAYQIVTSGDMLCFSDMVEDAKFKAGAKEAGARGAWQRKANKIASTKAMPAKQDNGVRHPWYEPASPILSKSSEQKQTGTIPATATKKPAPWYKTPAGWVRKGQEQAIQMQAGEAYEDFQHRVAKRFSDAGEWLDYIPKGMAKKIRDDIDAGKKMQEELKKSL